MSPKKIGDFEYRNEPRQTFLRGKLGRNSKVYGSKHLVARDRSIISKRQAYSDWHIQRSFASLLLPAVSCLQLC